MDDSKARIVGGLGWSECELRDPDGPEEPFIMSEPRPRMSDDEAVNYAFDQQAEALLKAQRLRIALCMSLAAIAGFGAGIFSTYKIACSLKRR